VPKETKTPPCTGNRQHFATIEPMLRTEKHIAGMNQSIENKRPKRRGPPLKTVGQVSACLGKVIRGMLDGSVSTADGARIANALGILRQCLETAQLAAIEERLAAFERRG
jgi:hypothetical protein